MFSSLSLLLLIAILFAAAGIVTFVGIAMSRLADIIADRTGLGEALIGGVLLGMATSLGGVVVTAKAALDGDASLAFSNAVGGIAIQTLRTDSG